MHKMQHIEQGIRVQGSKNYIKGAFRAMVRKVKQSVEKAEENKTRTQFWVTIIVAITIPVSVPFFSWLTLHLMNFGAQQARQEMYDKETQRLEKIIADKEKEIQALIQKQQPAATDVKPPKPTPQPTKRRGSRHSSKAKDLPLADAYAKTNAFFER